MIQNGQVVILLHSTASILTALAQEGEGSPGMIALVLPVAQPRGHCSRSHFLGITVLPQKKETKVFL
jgi:hypothetical protein